MTSSILGVLVCLSPILLVSVGYYIGRYGSPIVIRRQARRDRRAVGREVVPEESEVEVFRA